MEMIHSSSMNQFLYVVLDKCLIRQCIYSLVNDAAPADHSEEDRQHRDGGSKISMGFFIAFLSLVSQNLIPTRLVGTSVFMSASQWIYNFSSHRVRYN